LARWSGCGDRRPTGVGNPWSGYRVERNVVWL